MIFGIFGELRFDVSKMVLTNLFARFANCALFLRGLLRAFLLVSKNRLTHYNRGIYSEKKISLNLFIYGYVGGFGFVSEF